MPLLWKEMPVENECSLASVSIFVAGFGGTGFMSTTISFEFKMHDVFKKD